MGVFEQLFGMQAPQPAANPYGRAVMNQGGGPIPGQSGGETEAMAEVVGAMPRQVYDWAQANPLDAAVLGASAVPVVGDIAGFANDLRHMVQKPEERTWTNAGLAAAGLLPGVPPMAGMVRGTGGKLTDALTGTSKSEKIAARRAEANRNRFGEGWDVVDPNIDGELTQSAKDYFGVTRDPRETGYLMPDGARLDLSGRHYAGGYEKKGDRYVAKEGERDYLGGDRATDHRELYDLPGVEHGEYQWSAVEDLMTRTGAVRYIPNQGVSIIDGQKLSDKQISSIVKDFRRNGTPLSIDIDPKGGGSAPVNKTFDKPTVDSVKAFIDANSKGN